MRDRGSEDLKCIKAKETPRSALRCGRVDRRAEREVGS